MRSRTARDLLLVLGFLSFASAYAGVVTVPLLVEIADTFEISILIGARFAANQALLSEQLPSARGTVFALSASFASVALVVGAALGGLLVDRSGFGAIGLVCLAVGALVTAITFTLVAERSTERTPLTAGVI